MDPLFLTDANRESIRALVRMISPTFEEEIWEKVRIKREEEEASKKYYDQLQAQQAQGVQWGQGQWAGLAQQAATITTAGTGSVFFPPAICGLGGTTVVSPVTFTGIAEGTTTAVATPGFTNYTSIGSSFTAYDQLVDKAVEEMGLTKKGGGWKSPFKK